MRSRQQLDDLLMEALEEALETKRMRVAEHVLCALETLMQPKPDAMDANLADAYLLVAHTRS